MASSMWQRPAQSADPGRRRVPRSGIGARLRAHRERRGISLREVARRIGVSPSLVSKIERDRVNPSVATLWALVTELGLTMSDVFGEPSAAGSGDGRRGSPGASPVSTPDTRLALHLESGVRWERLTTARDPAVEFLYVVYPVGAASCDEDALITHGGKEYGYVISGRLGVRVGFDQYELGPGAAISFESALPHRLWTIGDEPVAAIWIVIGRDGDARGAE